LQGGGCCGKSIKWARESLNLTIEEVAHKLQKEAATIKAWEEGQDSPTYPQLEKLAYDILKRPLAVFFFPNPPIEESPKKSFRTLPEAQYYKLSSSLIRLFRQGQAMQIKLKELSDDKNPAGSLIINEINVSLASEAQDLAREIRKILGIDLKEQVSWNSTEMALEKWREAIQAHGVFVFKEAFKDDNISGCCLYDEKFPLIYLNNLMPKTRQIFTLFHELAHLLFKTGGIDKLVDDYLQSLSGQERYIEILCNKLASEFLVPDNDFDKQLSSKKIDDKLLRNLAERYWVSREVVLRKILDRGLVSEKYYETKSSEWAEEAKNRKKFDTSSFVVLFRHFYESRFPTLWENFNQLLADEVVLSVKEVAREALTYGKEDRFAQWAKANPKLFKTPSPEEVALI